jgi:LPXTG-motif cell wall-anchored protein
MSRRVLASMIAAVLLAATPAAAFADGAGDEQYQDPFSAPSTPKQTKKKATTAPATTAPAGTAAPAATPTLPRTGAPTELIGLAGVVLVASGAVMRRRTSAH